MISIKNPKNIEIGEIENKNFVIIVLTNNSESTIENNFYSIINQKYENYRIIYLDKGSTDGTVAKLKQLIKKEKKLEITLLSKKQEAQFFATYYHLLHKCHDQEIVVQLQSTDWLAHEEILTQINQVYSNPDVWLSYGQYIDYPSYKRGTYNPFPKKTLYRKKAQRAPWMGAYLKTFYAGLFKKATLVDFPHPDYFLSIKNEKELLAPIAEIGKAHVQFIPDVLYIHHRAYKEKRRKLKSAFIARKMKDTLALVASLPKNHPFFKKAGADLIVFSSNNPDSLRLCLQSVSKYMQGLCHIEVIYICSKENRANYEELQADFPAFSFINFCSFSVDTFKKLVLRSLLGKENPAPYVILTTDQIVVKEKVDVYACVWAMQKTGAYAFYLHLGWKGEKEKVGKDIYSWVIGRGNYGYHFPHPLEMSLYRKVDLERDVKDISFTDIEEFIELWAKLQPKERMGLSFDHSKISRLYPLQEIK